VSSRKAGAVRQIADGYPAGLARVQGAREGVCMTLDTTFFLVAVPAVVFAGISKGGFGSGAAFAATPLLALVVDPRLALGFMLPLLMLVDLATLRPYWGKWDWPAARLLMLGSLPGTALGAALYSVANADLFRFLIGALALAFVGFQLSRARGWVRPAARPAAAGAGFVAGAVAGFTSFVSHAGGPPVAIYLLSRRLTKTAFQATTVVVFFAVNITKAVPYAALGLFTPETLWANVLLAPAALAGAWLGVRAHQIVPERAFFGIAYTLLTITGSKLIWDALT
jgi:uncharacterized membrane protein YfcA